MDSFSAGLLFGFMLGAVATWPAYIVYTWLEERRKWRKRTEHDPTLERLRRLQDDKWREISDAADRMRL